MGLQVVLIASLFPQVIVEALILSMPMLFDVMVLALFYFSIFGIVCVELFKGKFLGRCSAPVFTVASDDNVMISGQDPVYVRR